MLSLNQPDLPNGPYRFGHHRQNSSPAVIDPRKAFSPATPNPPASFHRRGSSFDTPTRSSGTPVTHPGTPIQKQRETYDSTNQQQAPMHQHLAQETQQQQTTARPGHATDYLDEYFQQATTSIVGPQPDYGRPNSIHTLSNRNSNSSLEEDLKELLRKHNATDRDLASMLLDQGHNDIGHNQGQAVGGSSKEAHDQVQAQTDNIALQDQAPLRELRPLLQRPSTPTNRLTNGKYLLTPETTPASGGRFREGDCAPTPILSSPCKDENATIKAPPHMQRGISHDLFTRPDPFAEASAISSPPPSAPLVAPMTFGNLSSFDVIDLSNIKLEAGSQGQQSIQSSPVTDYLSYATDSFQSSPEMDFLQYNGPRHQSQELALFADLTNMTSTASQRSSVSEPTLMARSESICASSPEPSSDPPLVDTGIEASQIRAYIRDPEQPGGKWTCTYPECGKNFGRKENIKSHVQTHLGDRQWLCRHCQKCFVRLHDLKRHEKIHSGYKPHACKCGHTFARQDALTRHRQRGVCIGAIEGAIRKEIKRGRPRKTRPEHEERWEKADRARQRVLEKKQEASASDSSVCSFPSPPPMDNLNGGFTMSRETSTSYYATSPPELDLDFETDGTNQSVQFPDSKFFDMQAQPDSSPLESPMINGLHSVLDFDGVNESTKGDQVLKLFRSQNEWSAQSFET